MARGILAPRPGMKPTSLQWKLGILTTGPPGKLQLRVFLDNLEKAASFYTHIYSKKIACLLFVCSHIILENALETPQILQCTFWQQQQKIKPSFMSESSMGSLGYGMNSLLLHASRSWPHLSNAYSSLCFLAKTFFSPRSSLCEVTYIREYLPNMVLDNNNIAASVIVNKWVWNNS